MDGRQQPDPQPENDNDLNDEEIIDLTQVVAGEDDDIIDLKDILEQPDQAVGEPDEVVIPLVDTLAAGETTDPAEDMADDIIDLTEVTSAPAPDEEIIDLLDVATADTLEGDAHATPSTDEAEDVIDLLDAVEPEPAAAEDDERAGLDGKAQAILAETTDSDAESDPDPLDMDALEERAPMAQPDNDLTVLEDDQAITDPEEAPADADDEPAVAMGSPATVPTEIPDDIEPVAEEAIAQPIAAVPLVQEAPPASVPLTEQQVEDALERVIEKIYREKIELLLIQTVEKTVQREIEKIKMALLEDSDDMSG